MRSCLWACVIVVSADAASAQTVRVSGRIVEEGRGTPVSAATVRLTGSTGQVTDSAGRFQFGDVVPGRYIITVSSIGYRLRTIELNVGRDTSIVLQLIRGAVSLDTVIVRPKYLRIKGTAVDSASGDFLLQAQATLYPGSRFIGAANGTFTFDSVAPGSTTLVVEAAEHLPTRLELDLTRDTAFKVRMGVDSVALRMIAMQVRRLEQRSHSIPMPTKSLNREEIKRESIDNILELLARRTYMDIAELRKAAANTPDSGCFFVDDDKVSLGVFEGMRPEVVERVEIFRSAGGPPPKFALRNPKERNFGAVRMVRVYTRRFVAAMPRKETLPRILYMANGARPTCS